MSRNLIVLNNLENLGRKEVELLIKQLDAINQSIS